MRSILLVILVVHDITRVYTQYLQLECTPLVKCISRSVRLLGANYWVQIKYLTFTLIGQAQASFILFVELSAIFYWFNQFQLGPNLSIYL